ncbi:hypothetical protein IQ62_04645 [Streptomyces scabiei]|nr:hypothetical protein IQ62_04645 [Streptomyces scabiei]
MGPLAGMGVVERMRSIGVVIETAVEVPRPGRVTTDGRPVETADITVPDVRWEIAYEISIE